MALNRKYAALPDLDSAPDIYETPSLTDDASTAPQSTTEEYDDFSLETANISRHRLNPDTAREVFEGSVVDARNVDFSDRVSGKRKSYVVRSGGREDDDNEGDEGLERRIERLRREVEECRAEAERRRQEKHALGESVDTGITSEVENLGKLLEGIAGEGEDHDRAAASRLASALSSNTIGTPPTAETHDEEEVKPTYTISYAPDFHTSHEQAQAAAFDTRLALLEKVLGISSTAIPTLDSRGIPVAILPALNDIQQRMAILLETTPASLDNISRRVRALTQEALHLDEARKAAKKSKEELLAEGNNSPLTSTALKLADTEDSEHITKINALYGTLSTIENLSPLLPALLDRLRSLRIIHADAATVHESIERAMRQQEDMSTEIKRWKEGLEKVEKAVEKGENAMGKNVGVVEGWVKLLEDKVKTLEA